MKFLLATYDENSVPLDEQGVPLDVFNQINQAFMDMGVETAMQEFSRPQSAVGAIAEEVALTGGSPAERLFLALSDLRDATGRALQDDWGFDYLSDPYDNANTLLDELRAAVLP